MTIRWLLAAVHLLALGVGLGAVWARGRALQAPLDVPTLRRVFYADTWWGIAALLWISTGLVRAFGGYEKGAVYYLHNHLFWAKMGLPLRTDQLRPGSPRGAHGPGGHGDGARVRRAGAMK